MPLKTLTINDAYHIIWRGSYPDVVMQDGKNWEQFYSSYISTYIQNMKFKGFDMLNKLGMPIGHGGVLCFTKNLLPLTDGIDAIPIGCL